MNKWATITGSSNGIGAALADIFARNGYSIILHGRNENDLSFMYGKVTSYGADALIVNGEIKDPKTLQTLIEKSREKNVELFVNNVGYRCPGVSLEELTDEQINGMFEVNCTIPIKLTKDIYKYLTQKGRGCIMYMNSIRGLEPKGQRTIYAASRFAIRGFIESFRLEAREKNVHVMGIYPTRVLTKPEFDYGWPVSEVADKIYKAYLDGIDDLILDDRSIKNRPGEYPIEDARVHLLNP